jgi:hypothetical protein
MALQTASQHFVEIANIKNGVAILKSGQMCSILLASSVNFALKSSTEQQAMLSQFQAFLNTLDFSLQVYVQSRRLDIRPYLEILKAREEIQYNDLMRIQLREYMEFIRTFTNEVDIMSKYFFVVVPYTPSAIDVKGIASFLPGRKHKEEKLNDEKFEEDRSQLEQRVSVVEQGLARIGVRTIQLDTDYLTELYYHIYNPEDTTNAPKI